MTRKKYKSEADLPQEMVKIWQEAWKQQPSEEEPFVLEFPNSSKAVSIRQQLYIVRKKMVELNFANSQGFTRLEIQKDGKKLKIVIPSWISVMRQKLGMPTLKEEAEREEEKLVKAIEPRLKKEDQHVDVQEPNEHEPTSHQEDTLARLGFLAGNREDKDVGKDGSRK